MIRAVATQSRPFNASVGVEQLTLLPASTTNPRFVLSKSTRERGLRHVAEIREQLATRDAAGSDDTVRHLPARHDQAA